MTCPTEHLRARPSRPLRNGAIDVAGLRGFTVAPNRQAEPLMERFGRFLDSDLGARVGTGCMTFGFFALVMLAIDAAARAQGF